MEEKFNKAALLLEHWEEYLAISDSTGQTMEEEVQLFIRRVSKLEGLLKELYMKCNSTDDGNVILHLLDKCSKILDRVNGDKSLSAGGRFEWVNSILVKCLQEGSWLLVDNVNLCSAAVLDRLNALLEPNGVLTISERGVDDDGKMFEVKPHKDFRIFLTMDPKNGEISRAMRNRGVEIYMLNSSDASSSNQYDIKSLIDLEGLSNPNHIAVLLKVHEFISGLILSDQPNTTEILSCASLISQQLHHGIDVFEAFCTTCIEVYYKTRNPSEFNCNNVLEVIAEGIKRCFQESELTDFYNRNVTLNTTNFAKWSMLEKVKQQSAIYQSALKRFNQEKPLEVLKQSYRKLGNGQDVSIWPDIDQVKIQNDFFASSHFYTLANLLVIDYTLSSDDDVEYRTLYLRTITNQPEWQGALELFSKITKYFQWTNSRLPYDDRWVNDRGINSSSSNAINYALQIELHKLKDAFQIKYGIQNSLYNYLHALKKRQVTDAFTSPICSYYLELRSEHFMFMRQLCTHFTKDGSLNQTVVKVLELLSWRQALQGFLTSVRVPNQAQKSPRAFQNKLEALALYYKWFYKYSVAKVAELLNTKVPDSLNSILISINEHLEEHFSKSYKIAANYKKYNIVPEFYTMDWQLGALELLQSYDLFNPSTNVSRTLALFKRSQEFRSTLIGLKSNIYSNADLNSELSQLKTFKDNTSTEQCLQIQEREILPLVDALTEMLLLQIINAIYAKKELNLATLDKNILVNVDFNGALLKYKATGNERFLHEIKKEFYSAAANCPSARPSKFIDGAYNAEIGLSIAGVEPVFSKTIIQLLVDLENKCATLSNFKAVEEQREFLRLLVWDNMHALSSDPFDFINNQHSLLKNNLKNVLDRLKNCLKLSNISLDNFSYNDFKDPVLRKTIEQVQSSYHKFKTALASTQREDSSFSYVADIHLNLGFAELYLNSLLPRVDPLAKKAMKKNHIVSVISMFEQMKLSFESQNAVFSNEDYKHPYVQPIKEMIENLQSRLQKCGESSNIGVKSCSYNQVVQQVTHARSSIFKLTVLDDINDCTKMVEKLPNQPYSEEVMNKIQYYIDIFESSVPSFDTIIQDWNQLRGFYPDIIEPLLGNIFQFLYGFKLKLFWIKREVLKFQYNIQFKVNLENELLKLAELPSLNGNVATLNVLVESHTIQREGPFMNYILCAEQPAYVKEKEYVRLLKCEIQESFNQCIISAKTFRKIDQNLLGKFNELVETFISLWNAQQENKEREKAEAGSLYKMRSKCDDKTEEELIEEELKELLPNHHVLDFSDLQPQILSDSPVEVEVETDYKSCGLMTDEDLMFVVDLHSKLFKNFIRAEWLIPEPNKHILPDYVSPLREKYKLARRLMENHPNYFQYTLDKQLCASLAVLLEVSGKYDANEKHVEPLSPKIHNKKIKDFYKDSDVDEVKPCLKALNVLKSKVNELLEEWPEQPTLKTILLIIDRILNFDIKSPISRFLTGFDILLSKCHEWEEVAHSGVSLRNSTPELTAQIITWRKLELSRWKDLLSTTFTGLNKPLSKWWLYMYNLLKQYLHSDEVNKSQLIDTLQSFITKSPIAEFHGRLEMLLEFHCHAIGLPRSAKSALFISIIWNVYNYFNQFSTVITNKIKDLRSPIERKLKDYLKIVRWKDINYWSIRNTVDKTHKMLHKFVREYKGVLSQPVTPFLTNPVSENLIDNVGIWDRPQRQNPKPYHYTLDAESYMAKASIKDFAYLAKARKIAKETILSTEYPELLKCLDGFVTDVIETSSHLKNLEIDTSLTKAKQKSQAKTILNQKHRALADLFQSLTKMGVSFKTGLIDMKLKNPADNFTIKPIDLSASLTFLGLNSMDGKILTIWDSCELYYYRSVMRCEILHSALLTPAPDLGMQNIERCRGFAAHLLTICQQQKVNLIEATQSHYVLRGYAKQMREFCEYSSLISFKTLEDIQEVLGSLAVVTSQLQLMVNSCPEEQTQESQYIAIPQLKPDSDKLKRKDDENWKKINKSLNGITSLSAKMLQVMHKNAYYQPHISRDVVKPELVPFANKDQLYTDLQKLNEYLNNLKLIFDPIKVVDSIKWVSKSITLILEEGFKEQELDPAPEHVVDDLLQNFTTTILIKIQNVYKKYKEPRLQDDTEEELQLKPNHLKVLLTGNLAEDFQTFDLGNVLKAAEAVLTVLLGKSAQVSEKIINQTAKSLALFDQVLRLSEYFITQQVAAYRITCKLTSILMNIFIDLASKGFCVPPELSDEMDKEGVSKPSNGMGLGDGQGEKDVSDRIESEDQLDDAQPANQEKQTDEDPDCKEEDNAIEMSEDFDSKLQDKKPTGEDDEDQDNQGSDAEEQMGETEKGADQLDQEIWGEDKENDNEENDDLEEKEEDGKGGEKDGEDQLEAKGDKESKEKPERKEPSKDQTEESEKNNKEINEMNEPEFDDEQTDPYHGNQQELPEPEPMDLPDDLQLDEGEGNDGEQPEENPFDIDEMKDQQVPEDKPEDQDGQAEEDRTNDEEKGFSSDDEDVTRNEGDDNIEDEESESPNADEKPPEPEKIEEASTQDGDEPMEQANEEESALDETPSNQENIEAMQAEDKGATDKTQATQAENMKSEQPIDDICQEDKPDKEGMGQSQMEESETGHSVQSSAQQEAKTSNSEQEMEKKRKERPGQSDLKRSLGDVNEPVEKRLKTMEAKENDNSPQEEADDQQADMYQHIQEATKDKTKQVLDAATKDQVDEQKKEAVHEENGADDEEMEVDGFNEVPEDYEEEVKEAVADTLKENKTKSEGNTKQKRQHPEGEAVEEIADVEIEGEIVKTLTVSRGLESSYHTQYHLLQEKTFEKLSQEEINEVRAQVEQELSTWKSAPTNMEAEQTWQKISSVTSSLAQDLSEQLRLVLEPTQASHLRGDFRTGRRINMRKVIPYIASQFRKDKIWLRRTKPSKREYQIVLAIDDSASMADNHSKELAFESVALISKALSLLESGQLAVVSFGETTEIHHKLTEPFTDKCGVQLLQNFQFDQQKTYIGKLVNFVTEMFEQNCTQSSIPNAKLLLIVSDGQGVFSEGQSFVTKAVRRAKLANIFTVFVIIDNPKSRSSVLDIKSTIFKDGKFVGFQNYMDRFPFPFYLILRDINSLPGVLSDALMQWFEMVTSQQ
uniref:VWFA domain-containing protein n=1 Tax=Dendroctonus ponderosae TaxID=77166 RepID=A0AAR5QJL7_DENPD